MVTNMPSMIAAYEHMLAQRNHVSGTNAIEAGLRAKAAADAMEANVHATAQRETAMAIGSANMLGSVVDTFA